jgi:UDP:flavonoid glycosyltransferase YjiC (YdhE family)
MPHLVVDISGHGFGHAGQVIPVVRDLLTAVPELRVTLRTAVPGHVLARHVGRDLPVAPPPADVGLHMTGPMDVDVPASAAAYAALHADFPSVVAGEAARLRALGPDLLLADVPYSSIAAAARIGVPAVALCSLNWLDAYAAYCAGRPESAAIMAEIRDAYAAAGLFLQPRPHTPMTELANTRSIPPVCRIGTDRRDELCARLALDDDTALVAVAFGGLPGVAVAELPRVPGVRWLQEGAPAAREDISDASAAGLDFADLAASVDLVVTKSGYGTLCETLAAGTRLLMVSRPDWPEDAGMRAWLGRHGTAAVLPRAEATPAGLATAVRDLLARPRGAPVPPAGRAEAARRLRDDLGV